MSVRDCSHSSKLKDFWFFLLIHVKLWKTFQSADTLILYWKSSTGNERDNDYADSTYDVSALINDFIVFEMVIGAYWCKKKTSTTIWLPFREMIDTKKNRIQIEVNPDFHRKY